MATKGKKGSVKGSKRFEEAKGLVDKNQTYTVSEAIALAKKTATAKYDEAIELHVRLGINPSKSDQQIRGTISLPHGTGKTKRVAAFVEPAKEAEAKEAGADMIGTEELIAEIAQKGVINFDVAIATPKMMPKLAKLARILGPRGLMPNPKTDTVGPNVKKMVEEQKAGKESFKNDKDGNVHQIFGRASFSEAQLEENLLALLEQIKRLKPSASKGIYIKSANICSTLGPGIKIEAA
ncbi:50S ribosomal protein L1 [Candidatus Uhrbacteria bacterium CG_4_9_14_3_um_filter_50_9]|uniref:Large ribosomal subunit protein uL1 n=1 Tax=Candidatus Uhrbacteria bacterium CG_4_9_14_3_um_filter_50_9 TaxID=1975035 RepID=A0A2M7XCX3_9BACT|nr:MAG: 50S ribosomal protein L1 [Candidatus Uhrbacteria bacterium CG_4_9_14_3_um_filter_50_9]